MNTNQNTQLHIKQRVDKIKDDLELFSDDLEKYEYIIDLGKQLEKLEPLHEKDENLVQGCTSKVWLICDKNNDKLFFKANSNALIVKGLVYILISVFSNLKPKEILEVNLDILKQLGLSEIITPNRQSGVVGMLKRIREYATAFNKIN